jgi:hypothetical protein
MKIGECDLFQGAPATASGSKKPYVLLGGARDRRYPNRFNQTPWNDATCSGVCCQQRRTNRKREEL